MRSLIQINPTSVPAASLCLQDRSKTDFSALPQPSQLRLPSCLSLCTSEHRRSISHSASLERPGSLLIGDGPLTLRPSLLPLATQIGLVQGVIRVTARRSDVGANTVGSLPRRQ